jgi:phosphoglycolate phosphatase-like HAD superfamily hydrolase
VLDAGDWIDHVTNADDVDTAKPEPDVVQVALDRAGVGADRAVLVGDTVWDCAAARRAGVTAVGVRSGGVADAELTGAGAAAVVDDCTELRERWRELPIGALLSSSGVSAAAGPGTDRA